MDRNKDLGNGELTASNLQKKKDERKTIKNNLDEKTRIKTWIRTLLYSYKNFPKIIDTLDKIIISRASEYSFTASIFNLSDRPESQYNAIINMTERKQKLLNIYVMTKQLFDSLNAENYELAYKKFCELQTNDEIAIDFCVSTRTIFRKISNLIENLYHFTLRKNWSLKFFELQVCEENWLIDKYNRNLEEYVIDTYK